MDMEKIDYVHGTFVILDNMVNTQDFDRLEYEEDCEFNGMEPGDDHDFYEWCVEETENNYEQDMENIDDCKEYNVPVVVEGTLGLWDGRRNIVPVRKDSVGDAIRFCIRGSDADYITAKYKDGVVSVECYHHDGCNTFTVRALSAKGVAKKSDNFRSHDFRRLPYLYAIY